MANIPRPTKDSKVGSNLKGHKALAAAGAALREQRLKPLRRAEQKFLRQRREILTRPIVRHAAPIFREHRDVYDRVFLKAYGNGAQIAKARQRARASIDRELRHSIPRFTEYEALRQKFARDSRELIANHLVASRSPALDVSLGDILLPDGVPFEVFKPPFELFDVTPLIQGDNSFAKPGSGIVVTNFQLHDDESSFGGFDPARVGEFHSSVGINFRVPQTGFLNGTASIQNLFNKIVLALQDNFGFSSGELHVAHTIFVEIVRSGEATRFERTMLENGLISHGSDLHLSFPPIQNSTPFTISFASQDAFLKGEQIQLLVGAAITTRSRIDDMQSFVTALTMWQVKSLSVGIRT